jgi:predicted transcriptional regulator
VSELVTRADFVREAQRLRAEGLLQREIANRFSVSLTAVNTWLSDPDLSKQRARRKRYRGTCEDCGRSTDGSNGKAKAPKLCAVCYGARCEPEHGTLSRYTSRKWRCRCDDCREANRLYVRSLQGKPPPRHGNSGYVNYGCRCVVCTKGNRDYQWLHSDWRQRWAEKLRGTEPPRHGYSVAYQDYGCRCDLCRAWNAAASRKYQAKKRQVAA